MTCKDDVLKLIRCGICSYSDIIGELRYNRATIAEAIRQLKQQNLIYTLRDPDDHRSKYYYEVI